MLVRRGFSLIEIVVVTGLSLLILVGVVIFTIRFMKNRVLEASAQIMVSDLRTAQTRAVHSEGNTGQGVSRANGQITLFRGASYASRQTAYDELRRR